MFNSINNKEMTTMTEQREIVRGKRSSVLHQMQLLGVDTADWDKVDALCRDRRIAGKRFCELDCDELDALLKKLRAIRRKQNTLKNK